MGLEALCNSNDAKMTRVHGQATDNRNGTCVWCDFWKKAGQMLQGQAAICVSSLLINTTKIDIDDGRNRDGNGVYGTEP